MNQVSLKYDRYHQLPLNTMRHVAFDCQNKQTQGGLKNCKLKKKSN